MVSMERHQDGNIHFHCLATFSKKKDIRNPRFFDFESVHPNVQACKNVCAWKTYIKKDGDWMEYPTSQSIFDRCYDSNYNDWIEYCVTQKIQSWYCQKIWEMCHVPRENTITERPENGTMCLALEQFEFQDWNQRSLVLYGESGVGKTTWAKRHIPLPCLFVSHLDVLKDYDSTYHRGIIFDDVSFMHFPRESQIHIVDTFDPRAIHCRYRVAHIPASTPKVFTANRRILMDDPAINRRISIQKINGYDYDRQ